MKTIAKLFAAAFVSVVMLTSQAFAGSGQLYPLDPWNSSVEGHMSAEEERFDDMGRDH